MSQHSESRPETPEVEPYIIVVGGKVAQSRLTALRRGSTVALNPQPLPPGPDRLRLLGRR